MKAFKIQNPDDAYIAVDRALALTDAVQGLLSDGGPLMKLIEESDSLRLFKSAADALECAKQLERWLAHVEQRQNKSQDESEE